MRSPVSRKMLMALGGAMLLPVLVVCLVCTEAERQKKGALRAVYCRQLLATLDNLTANLSAAEMRRCAYVTHAEPAQREAFSDAASNVRENLQQLRKLTLENAFQYTASELASTLAGKKLALLERSLQLRDQLRFHDRGQFALTREVHGVNDELVPVLAGLRAEADGSLDSQTSQTRSSVQYAGMVVGAGGLLMLLFFGLSAVGVSRELVNRNRSWTDARAAAQRAEERAIEQSSRLSETEAALEELASLRGHLEDQLHQAQRLASVGRVTSGVAHDFNNLLQLILGYSEASLQTLPEDDPSRPFITEVVQAGYRAVGLTRQLLGIGRIGDPQPMDLNAALVDVGPLLCQLAGKDIELKMTLDPCLKPIWADRGRLDQVLLNLVANARDAMPEGGKLTLETRPARPDEAAPKGEEPAREYAVLMVTDTGCGMDAETRARLFEPFFTTKDAGKGTGLGMAIILDVVGRFKGRVEVDSEVGQGTTIRVYLPLAE